MNVERARRASRGENEGPDDGRAIFIVVAPERRLVNVLYMAAQSKRPRSCCENASRRQLPKMSYAEL